MSIQKACARYKPIETHGLTLYPIKVLNYTEFLIAKAAIEVMHQSLPVAMMRVPLLSALYQMDYEAILNDEPPSGLFSRSLLALALSLRLGEGESVETRMRMFEVAIDRENPAKLLRLRFIDGNGNEQEITPAAYSELRKIIAAQNGVKLESDLANPNLVQAEKDMQSAAMTLDPNIDDLICAVSSLSGVEESEIDEWPILKLNKRAESYRRILDYIVCGVGEASGTTWKEGNPTPHPFFAKLRNGSGVLPAMGGRADGETPQPPQAATAIREITKNLS